MISPVIRIALKEDIGPGDITSQLLVGPKEKIGAVILAKEKGIVCGLDAAKQVFAAVDKKIRFHARVKDGQGIKPGDVLVRLQGNARNILKAERTALNFLGRLSGIATLTNQYVQRIRPYKTKIMDTRKTTPGLRILEKYAVRCGGGVNHRMGLWDQILIKDNHLSVACRLSLVSSKKTLKDIVHKIKQKAPKKKIEVEVKNIEEFKEALNAGPDIIMLDNFSLREIKKAVKIRNSILDTRYKILATRHKRSELEISGGVSLNNVRKIAACGVERISVGELTHSVKSLDTALNCE